MHKGRGMSFSSMVIGGGGLSPAAGAITIGGSGIGATSALSSYVSAAAPLTMGGAAGAAPALVSPAFGFGGTSAVVIGGTGVQPSVAAPTATFGAGGVTIGGVDVSGVSTAAAAAGSTGGGAGVPMAGFYQGQAAGGFGGVTLASAPSLSSMQTISVGGLKSSTLPQTYGLPGLTDLVTANFDANGKPISLTPGAPTFNQQASFMGAPAALAAPAPAAATTAAAPAQSSTGAPGAPASAAAATDAKAADTKAADKKTADKKAADKKAAEKPAPAAAKPAAPKTVKVVAGDTLSAIAAKNGTTVEKLHEANKAAIGADPNKIMPGLELKLPA